MNVTKIYCSDVVKLQMPLPSFNCFKQIRSNMNESKSISFNNNT